MIPHLFVENPEAAYTSDMDIQETIDSLRKLLEGVIAPGVESLRLRLDALEKDLRETGQSIDRLDKRVDHLAERMEDGFARMDARMDRLDSKMDNLAERMDARLDALMAVITSTRIYPDTLSARLDHLEREVQALRKT
ncbi:hypothetical protein [Acidithiobacillus thiooxidans]|uniref:hypothetical protein n=1 Tax=Acidithiobacillus thiooxidans TaxID=930 RepID=UPI001D032ACD|nr:hypothetical protein [Acidithiobacillus thiooxidans]